MYFISLFYPSHNLLSGGKSTLNDEVTNIKVSCSFFWERFITLDSPSNVSGRFSAGELKRLTPVTDV